MKQLSKGGSKEEPTLVGYRTEKGSHIVCAGLRYEVGCRLQLVVESLSANSFSTLFAKLHVSTCSRAHSL